MIKMRRVKINMSGLTVQATQIDCDDVVDDRYTDELESSPVTNGSERHQNCKRSPDACACMQQYRL